MKNITRLTASLMLGGSTLVAGIASAQTAPQTAPQPQAAQQGGVPEIIVTAQKRAQKLSDVPVTIVAATGDQLRQSGVADISQLAKIAPSFTVSSGVYGYQSFAIRGISFNSQQLSAAPAVSAYIDEAALPYTAMTGGMLLDVERIEVLKGPQGTLFGQNATAGSINVIAAKPTADPHAGFKAEVNHFGQVMFEGFVSGPVSPNLLARVAATTTQFGAYQRGYYLYHGKNGDQNKGAARLLLDWTPTDRLRAQVNLNANYDHGEFIQPQLGIIDPAIPAAAQPGLVGYPPANDHRDVEIPAGFDTHTRNRMYQGVLRLDYDITDDMTLTSITNYADFKMRIPINYSGIALNNATNVVYGRIKTFNQEARLAGKAFDGALDYVLGGNYTNDRLIDGQYSYLNEYSGTPAGSVYQVDYKPRNRSTAVFGNVDFHVTPQLTLSAGARYTWVKQSLSGCVYGNEQFNGLLAFIAGAYRGLAGLGPVPAGYFAPGTCATINDNVPNVQNPNGPGLVPDNLPIFLNSSQKEKNFSWRGSASYKLTDDSLIYATVSRGFKAGVFPVQPNLVNSEATPVVQEKLTSYEAGAKLSFFDRAVRLDASVFYYDYRDKQFNTYFPLPIGGVSSFITNIPKSNAYGFDADLTINPSRSLTLRAAVTHLRSEVENFVAIGGSGEPIDVSGKDFNYAPRWSGSFDAEYRIEATDTLEAFVGGGGQFSGRSFSDLGELEITRNKGFVTVDARVGVRSSNGWRASLWARNLTDEYYWNTIFKAGDMYSKFAAQPRTFGATVGFDF